MCCKFILSWLFIPFFLLGCSTSQHHKKADMQVYQILEKAEKYVFGKSEEFTINTKYSSKKTIEIKAAHLLKESQSGGELTLNIDQALSYSARNSREYQSQKETLYLAALSLTGVRNTFSPNFSSTASARATNQADGDVRGTTNLNQRISQNLTTGGSYSLALANDLLSYFTGDPRKSAASVVSLNILQPLLRGAGSEIAAERFTQSNRNVIYSIRDYHHFQNTFSKDIVIQYLRLMQQKESVSNQYKNYISRKQNTEYLRARSVDRASPQEVSDSEQGELQAKNSWINAKSRYQTSLDAFKITLGAPTSVKLNLTDNELDKLVKSGLQPLIVNQRQAFDTALRNRLPLINDIDRFDDSKRQVVIAANQLKAQVNFIASASLASTGNNFEKLNLNNLSSQVGVELNLPINRINERNNYRLSLIRFQSSIRSLSRTYDSLNNLIIRRIREVQQFKQNYDIQRNAVKLAERRVEGNRLRFQAGTVIFRRLSESQDALISAQNAVTAALIDYQDARLQLYTDIGTLSPNTSDYWLNRNPTR
ncbi:MAG: outer membrane protein TolC [Rubritalea sp.]|jgi:outer membrane protein TolC|tara:strand:+ start:4482 stop:6095 length:1614 start_codon:yes stop_codon:yes gene_type:complete